MVGPLFIMAFRNWTHEEAADASIFHIDAQSAVNRQPERQSLCRRTFERSITLFREAEVRCSMLPVVREPPHPDPPRLRPAREKACRSSLNSVKSRETVSTS